MNKIKIVCDSLSDISQDYLDLYDIDMLPLSIIILHMVPSMRILKSIVKKVMISYIFQLLQVLQAPTRVL